MRAPKPLIIAAISLLATTVCVAPAQAQTYEIDFSAKTGFASYVSAGQTLQLSESDTVTASLAALTAVTAVDYTTITHNFDVAAAIAAAQSEIGTSRVTGWSQPGECIISANRWLRAGGANWATGGTPVSNYNGALRLPLSAALPGDIVQYENLSAPDSWVTGVHTMLIVGVNEDGTYHIIHSNYSGTGLVTEEHNFKIEAPAGFQAVVWRF